MISPKLLGVIKDSFLKISKKVTLLRASLAATALMVFLVLTEDAPQTFKVLELGEYAYRYGPCLSKNAVKSDSHGSVPLYFDKETSYNEENAKSKAQK